LLIVAGAGSGKTRVLTHRIAYLVQQRNVSPFEILAITFTNKAASEMRHRVGELVGPVSQKMWVSTFHSACVRILRRDAERIGYKPGFTIYDQSDAVRLTQQSLKALDIDTKRYTPRGVHGAISNAKNELVGPEAMADKARLDPYLRRVADVYRMYQDRLVAANAMDFDDLLVNTVRLLQQHEDIRQRYQRRFKYLLVDEYQDTNRAQNEIVLLIGKDHGNVCVVGDGDQSVYGWRGADMRNFLEFEEAFPDTTTIVLSRNYRSTSVILDAANSVISNNELRKPKDLWTDRDGGTRIVHYQAEDEYDEATWVAHAIDRLHRAADREFADGTVGGFAFSEMAVFYRANAQSRAIEERLTRAGVPYKVVGGTKFYDRKEIKDALAYLNVLANPSDAVSFERIVNTPKRGIGDTSVAKLRAFAFDNGLDMITASHRADQAGIGGKAAVSLRELAKMLDELRHGDLLSMLDDSPVVADTRVSTGDGDGGDVGGSAQSGDIDSQDPLDVEAPMPHTDADDMVPGPMLEKVLERSGYLTELRAERSIESEGRLENLAELIGVAQEYASLREFLEDTSLVADSDEIDDDAGQVVLMTLHTAKGLEYPAVFLVGMEEGVFPHVRTMGEPEQLEEERRLAYVGITRAKERLYVSNAWSRSLWGGTQYNPPSRFLREIPEHLVEPAPGSRRDLRGSTFEDHREREVERAMRGGRGTYDPDDDTPQWSDPDGGTVFGGGGSTSRGSGGGSSVGRYGSGAQFSAWGQSDRAAQARTNRGRIVGPRSAGDLDRLAAEAAEAKARNQGALGLGLKSGDDVVHPKFGEGVVLEVLGEGERSEAVIRFPGVGEKRLLLAWAHLKLA
jgi:DNA helicase-2/ATP-dependent DNA helicase PcrA